MDRSTSAGKKSIRPGLSPWPGLQRGGRYQTACLADREMCDRDLSPYHGNTTVAPTPVLPGPSPQTGRIRPPIRSRPRHSAPPRLRRTERSDGLTDVVRQRVAACHDGATCRVESQRRRERRRVAEDTREVCRNPASPVGFAGLRGRLGLSLLPAENRRRRFIAPPPPKANRFIATGIAVATWWAACRFPCGR